MHKKTLSIAVLGALLICFLTAGWGQQKSSQTPYKIVMAHSTTTDTSMHQGFLKFKELAEKNSNGRIIVEIYPNAQLGGDREIIEGTQLGNITVIASSTAPQVNFVKEAAIFDMPFVLPDKQTARKVFDGPFKDIIGKKYEAAGFKLVGFSDQGFRELTLNKIVRKPTDLRGIKIRTMENPYHMELWRQLGANPTPIPFNELYTALQQKTVDGQENPYELIYSQKFYEQQKYIINTNHIFQTIGMIMNKQFYDSLPNDLKKVVDDAGKEAINFARKYQDDNEVKYIEFMKKTGIQVIDLTPTEIDAFKEKSKPVWDRIRKDVGNDIVDAYLNAIKD